MKKLLLAALAACALVYPARGQPLQVIGYTVPVKEGTLTTITTDTVVVTINGGQWATAQFSVTSAGTATATAQISIDGGTNWIASAYAKRLSTVSANPTVQAISSTTLVTGDVWEVGLPSNATQFRLLCGASGTVTTVRLFGGVPYVPGAPVKAVLYDVTEGSIGAGLTTGTIDISGWVAARADILTPTTQVWTLRSVDDAGSLYSPAFTTTAATSSAILMSPFGPAGGPGPLASGVGGVWPFIDKRINLTLPAGGTVSTGRMRIVAYR